MSLPVRGEYENSAWLFISSGPKDLPKGSRASNRRCRLILRLPLILGPDAPTPGHGLVWKFDQEQAFLFTNVIYFKTAFADQAPMNDDLLGSTMSSGNGHNGF